jgi:sulfite reductase alpha subunit-like flavoprotein
MVKYRTKLKLPRKGVCTSYLSGLRPGDALQVGLKKGTIRLPLKIDTPLVCVGPGTGIAPMRAVIEERIHSGARCTYFLHFTMTMVLDHIFFIL